jgi:hypothetical protein
MATVIAWALFALGVAHIAFGLVRFRAPIGQAVVAGFVGQFKVPEVRRTAFWFLMVGPLLMLAGHIAVHAAAVGDLSLFKVIGWYMLVSSAVGVTAYPKSPLWAPLLLSPLFIAAGHGMLP